MTIEHIETHARDAPELLTEQYRDKPNMRAWLETNGARAQVIEDVLADMRTLRSIDASIGAQLDAIGRIIGQDREGRDDATYRLWIKARVIVNRSSGLPEEFYKVAEILLSEEELRAIDAGYQLPGWETLVTGVQDYIRGGTETTGGSGELVVQGALAGWTFSAPASANNPDTSGDGWSFDSVNAYLESTDAGLLSLFEGTAPWTVAFRARFNDSSPFTQTFMLAFSDDDNLVNVSKSGALTYRARREVGGAVQQADDSSALSTTLRKTVGVTFTGTEIRLYVDGALVDTVADSASMAAISLFLIGASTSDGSNRVNLLNAEIFEVLFSDAAIIDGEHLSIHNNLAADWPNEGEAGESGTGQATAPGFRLANDGPSPEPPLQIARILREVKSGGVPFRYSFAPPSMAPFRPVFHFTSAFHIVPSAGFGFDAGGRFADVLEGKESPDEYPPGSWEYFESEDAVEGSLTVRGRVRRLLLADDVVAPQVDVDAFKDYLGTINFDQSGDATAMRADGLAQILDGLPPFSVAWFGEGSFGSEAILVTEADNGDELSIDGDEANVSLGAGGGAFWSGQVHGDEKHVWVFSYDGTGNATWWLDEAKKEVSDSAVAPVVERVSIGAFPGATNQQWPSLAGIAFFDHALSDDAAIEVQRWMTRRFRGITPDVGPAQNLTPASITVDDGPDWNPGDTLTVTPGTWLLAEHVDGVWTRDGSPIAGETGGTYVVQTGDIGTEISYEETAFVEGESDVVQVAITAETVVGTAVNVTAPIIANQTTADTGDSNVGDTLILSTPGVWEGAESIDGQWTRDHAPIVGATGTSYVVQEADAGARVRYEETAHVTGEPDVTTFSLNGSSSTIRPHFSTPPALVNDTTGTFPAAQDDVLSVDISGLLGEDSVTYQWLDTDGVAIPGETAATYTTDTVETGDGVSCLVTASNAGGSTPATTAEEAVSAGAAPDAFTAGDWELNGTDSVGTLEANILNLPADNGDPITDIEYRANGGAATSLGTATTGPENVAGLTSDSFDEDDIEIRAVNSIGPGPWSDVKSANPPIEGLLKQSPVASFAASPDYLTIDGSTNVEVAVDVSDPLDSAKQLEQSTAGERPAWLSTSSMPSGVPAIQGDGVDDVLETTTHSSLMAALASSAVEVYVLAHHGSDTSVTQIAGAGQNTSTLFRLETSNPSQIREHRNGDLITTNASGSLWSAMRYDGVDLSAETSQSIEQSTPSASGISPALFSLCGNSVTGQASQAEVVAYIAFDRILSDSERQAVQTILAGLGGLGMAAILGMGQSNMERLTQGTGLGYEPDKGEPFENLASGGTGYELWLQGETLYNSLRDAILERPFGRVALWWAAGEFDSQTTTDANLALTRMEAIASDLQTDCPNHDLRFFLARLHPDLHPGTYPEQSTVRQAIVDFVAADTSVRALVDLDDLTLDVDSIHHLDSNDLVILGRYYAATENMEP